MVASLLHIDKEIDKEREGDARSWSVLNAHCRLLILSRSFHNVTESYIWSFGHRMSYIYIYSLYIVLFIYYIAHSTNTQ